MGFGNRSTGRGTLGANYGRAIVTNGDLLSQRRGPLPKLLWVDLFLLLQCPQIVSQTHPEVVYRIILANLNVYIWQIVLSGIARRRSDSIFSWN